MMPELSFLFYAFVFLFGLVIGSFLNVVIYRLPKEESFLGGRSYCPKCKSQINWYDNIPLFSFILLRGKCRRCGKKISWQYPLVEMAAGMLFVLTAFYFGLPDLMWAGDWAGIADLFFYSFIVAVFILIFVFDLKYYIIPDELVFPAVFLGGIRFLLMNWGSWENFLFLFYSLLPALFFTLLIIVSRGRWMGWGDVKLAVLMALVLGWPKILAAIFLSFLAGSAVGVVLVCLNRKEMSGILPFGVFLTPATFAALFFGDVWITWYLGICGFLVE